MDSLLPQLGSVIGDTFRVEGLLGEGAMGVVILATDVILERRVAIKIIRQELLDSPELRERFLDEARAMARVNHPNVLNIHAFGELEGTPYFVMEYVEGRTLDAWMHERRAYPPDMDEALRVLQPTCLGVEAIHAARTVHRDLKPSNILLDAEMRVRVADLGLANVLGRAPIDSEAPRDIAGTPAYMAPEIARQLYVAPEVAHRADVYSLGCIAFELLCGRPPFVGKTPIAVMLKHMTEAPPVPTSLRADLPPEIDQVLARALAKDPFERTPSADALRRELLAARDRTTEPVRILVAEDDADFREALEMTLEREFPTAEIESVGDGAAALAAFDQRHHSVAIVDLRMPKLDGLELTGLLRARSAAATTPIIVLTASGGPDDWKRLSAMGADGFLVKPVNLKDVVTLVRRALGDRARSSAPPTPPALQAR